MNNLRKYLDAAHDKQDNTAYRLGIALRNGKYVMVTKPVHYFNMSGEGLMRELTDEDIRHISIALERP
jgi:peptidyl-tRNA hydrolase